MDSHLGRACRRREIVAMLRYFVAAFLEESLQGKVDGRLSSSVFSMQQQVLASAEVEHEGLVKGAKSLQANLRDFHIFPSIMRTVSRVCSLSSAIRRGWLP